MVMNPSGRSKKRRGGKRRKRSAKARRNPSHKRRRSSGRRRRASARRNPSFALPRVGGLDLGEALWGVGGAIGADVAGNLVQRFLPPQAQKPIVSYLVKGGLIAFGSMLLGKFVGRGAAKTMALGGAVVLGFNAFNEYLRPHIPFLSGYDDQTYFPTAMGGYALQPALGGLADDGSWSPAWSE